MPFIVGAPAPLAPGEGHPPLAPVLASAVGFTWDTLPAQGGLEYASVGAGVPILPELAPFGSGITAPLLPSQVPFGNASGPPPTEVPEPPMLWVFAGAALAAVWGRR